MADQEEDQGITAYHGSPHEFEQFDLSKIGTGEGAQAYGHGLYFAENEPVARNYRDQLSGREYRLKNTGEDVSKKFGQDIVDIFEQSGGNKGEIYNTLSRLQNNVIRGLQDAGVSKISDLNESHNPMFVEDIKNTHDKAERLAQFLRSGDAELHKGHMYEVSINAHPDHFLDWDKPLNEQSEHVKSALVKQLKKYQQKNQASDKYMEANFHKEKSGGEIYKDLASMYGSSDASNELMSQGIHGIKYLDAGSRNKQGDLTRNYVVFDDKLVNVKRKYALGGDVEGYADGGAVEDRDRLGFGGVGEGPVAGSTGSAGGNSYGGGSSGDTGGVSMSSGNGRDNNMAAARAADRASVAGYSASPTSAGGGFGGGDGRDYADPRNRAYSEQMAKSARDAYLEANFPQSPRLGDLAQPVPAALPRQPDRAGSMGSMPIGSNQYAADLTRMSSQPTRPVTPTPFSGYSKDVQNSMIPDRPDSSFGGTLADPTGKYTNEALQNMGTATDALTMLNSPTLMGSVVRAFAPTPSQPTPRQEQQMANIFGPDMPIARIGDPSLGARAGSAGSMPSGTTSYGSDLTPSGSSVSRPVTPTPSTAYGGNSSQDSSNRGLGSFAGSLGAQGPAQQSVAPRQDFNSAFAAARSGGNKTFNWTNPRTGKTGTYGTQLARKEGGRVPSMSEPDEWLIDENETEKKPVKKANKQVSKPERSPIVSRALMVSSRKS